MIVTSGKQRLSFVDDLYTVFPELRRISTSNANSHSEMAPNHMQSSPPAIVTFPNVRVKTLGISWTVNNIAFNTTGSYLRTDRGTISWNISSDSNTALAVTAWISRLWLRC